jgi:Ca2+-binding EF-hand superfamily protein
LRQYYEYWIAFNRIDSDSDRRISKDEFTKALPTIKKWGLTIPNPSQTFAEIDTDKAGMILFDEFCEWAIKKNLDLDDDDNLL